MPRLRWMRRSPRRDVTNLTLSVVLLLLTRSALAQRSRFSITDLGTLGGTMSQAYGINDSGQVAGTSTDAGDAHNLPFRYTGGVLSRLSTLPGGTFGFGFGINNRGDVAGFTNGRAANGTVFTAHAFRYHLGVMTDLGTLGGDNSLAYGINDQGDTVGNADLRRPPFTLVSHAFLYRGGTMHDIGTLGGSFSRAFSVNESDSVVGYSFLGRSGPLHAFLYQGGVMSDLGTLGGLNSLADDINNAGQIVGDADLSAAGITHAFLYDSGIMSDLGTLPGGTSSVAQAINDAGQVVGSSDSAGNASAHAFLYDNGVITDLNAAIHPGQGWTLGGAYDINNEGQIVGIGTIHGETHGYLLTPDATVTLAAEPGTLTLALVGLAGLGSLGLPHARRRHLA